MFAKWLTILFWLLAANHAAAEVTIFSVNKTLSMGPTDTVFRDYYLNGGTDDGFRRGMLVTVVRRVPVHDLSRNRALGDLKVPVAKVKLIYVSKSISVGRLDKLMRPTNLPATEFPAVMIGDLIVLGDGLDDLGKMDDGLFEDAEGSNAQGSDGGGAPEAGAEIKIEPKPEVAVAPAEVAKPEGPVPPLPEKNAEKPVLETREPSSAKIKKESAKAVEEEKKPLKLPTKPDNSSEHAVIGPTA